MSLPEKERPIRVGARNRAKKSSHSQPLYPTHSAEILEPRRVDFRKVNRAALASLPAVLARILPSGKAVHREWLALNPRRGDRHLGSF
jgi:hypothetical protein